MSVLASALAVRRLVDEHPALRMLRADTLAIMAATLGVHLGSPGVRLPAMELHELIDGDLEQLRDHFALSAKNPPRFGLLDVDVRAPKEWAARATRSIPNCFSLRASTVRC